MCELYLCCKIARAQSENGEKATPTFLQKFVKFFLYYYIRNKNYKKLRTTRGEWERNLFPTLFFSMAIRYHLSLSWELLDEISSGIMRKVAKTTFVHGFSYARFSVRQNLRAALLRLFVWIQKTKLAPILEQSYRFCAIKCRDDFSTGGGQLSQCIHHEKLLDIMPRRAKHRKEFNVRKARDIFLLLRL